MEKYMILNNQMTGTNMRNAPPGQRGQYGPVGGNSIRNVPGMSGNNLRGPAVQGSFQQTSFIAPRYDNGFENKSSLSAGQAHGGSFSIAGAGRTGTANVGGTLPAGQILKAASVQSPPLEGWAGIKNKFVGNRNLMPGDAGYGNQYQWNPWRSIDPNTGLRVKSNAGMSRMTSFFARDTGYSNMSTADQNKLKAEQRGKAGSAAVMGAMMVGGMITSSAGNNKAQAGLGTAISGAGMGGMLGSMSGAAGGTGIGAGAGAAIMLGNYIKQNNAKTSKGGQALGSAVSGAGMGVGLGLMATAASGGLLAPLIPVLGGVGAAVGGLKGYLDADKAERKQTKAQIEEGGMTGRKGGFSSAANFRNRYRGRLQKIADFRKDNARLKEIGKSDWDAGHGLLKKAEDVEYNAKPGKEKDAATKKVDKLKAEKKALEASADDRKDQMVGLKRDESKFIKEGRQFAVSIATGKMFGLDSATMAAYAAKHNIKLQQEGLGIRAMAALTGYSLKASEQIANLGLSAKRLSELVTNSFAPGRAEASAIITQRSEISDYLGSLNEPKTKEEGYLANTDVLTSISDAGSAMLASGAFGKDEGAFGRYQTYMTSWIDEVIGLAKARPGADTATVEGLVTTGAATKELVAGNQNMGFMSTYDPAFIKESATRVSALTDSIAASTKKWEDKDLSPAEIAKRQAAALEKGTTKIATEMQEKFKLTDKLEAIKATFASTTVDTLKKQGVFLKNKIFDNIVNGSDYFAKAIRTTFRNIKFVEKDGKFVFEGTEEPKKKDEKKDGGDTSTSRFGRTFAKHAALNSMLPGTRTITSGLRNFNLGSGSSDHLTGNAYDLTGDNLGAYAGLVKASGGFAEFHGAAGGRHLHVVPAHGDTSAPRAGGGTMATSVAGGTVNNSYSIVVNGGPGSSPAEIADQVMLRIQRANRDTAERS